jgi:hypothetical protein
LEGGSGMMRVRVLCLAGNLKHLQRFLRRDDPSQRDIFMQLGKWNTIRQDILPIIIHYRHDFDLVLNAGKHVFAPFEDQLRQICEGRRE